MIGDIDSNNSSSKVPLYRQSQENQDEINAFLKVIESYDDLSIDEVMDIIENRCNPAEPTETKPNGVSDFVLDRVATLSKNIDFAQAQAELLTKEVGAATATATMMIAGENCASFLDDGESDDEDDEPISVSEFVQARMGIFLRNLETVSSAVVEGIKQ